MKEFKTSKGTTLQVMQLKGKDYMMVHQRLVWFREEKPNWSVETFLPVVSEKETLAKAIIRDEKGIILATAHKRETLAGFSDHTEKAETGAVGRALLFCGYGTAFAASELDEGERIVDSPVEGKTTQKLTTMNTTTNSNQQKQWDHEYKVDEKIPTQLLDYYPEFSELTWKQAALNFPEKAAQFYTGLIKYQKEKGKLGFKEFNIEKFTYLLEMAQENYSPPNGASRHDGASL